MFSQIYTNTPTKMQAPTNPVKHYSIAKNEDQVEYLEKIPTQTPLEDVEAGHQLGPVRSNAPTVHHKARHNAASI
jgi:hypothetical protein